MTPTEYRAALKLLSLTQNGAAEFVGVNPVTGRRWAKHGPPAPVAKLFRLMLALKFTPSYVDSVIGS